MQPPSLQTREASEAVDVACGGEVDPRIEVTGRVLARQARVTEVRSFVRWDMKEARIDRLQE
jgi:hypothetical protein